MNEDAKCIARGFPISDHGTSTVPRPFLIMRGLLERATGIEPATSSLERAPTREGQGDPRMKILELKGFSNFRFPAFDPDFRSFPGNFGRNLPENLPFRGEPDSTKTNLLMTSSFGRASANYSASQPDVCQKVA